MDKYVYWEQQAKSRGDKLKELNVSLDCARQELEGARAHLASVERELESTKEVLVSRELDLEHYRVEVKVLKQLFIDALRR